MKNQIHERVIQERIKRSVLLLFQKQLISRAMPGNRENPFQEELWCCKQHGGRKVGFIEPVNISKPRHSKFHQDPRPVHIGKGCVTCTDAEADLKELNPDHIEYLSERVVGRGSYGECYRAQYRGIDVIVK